MSGAVGGSAVRVGWLHWAPVLVHSALLRCACCMLLQDRRRLVQCAAPLDDRLHGGTALAAALQAPTCPARPRPRST